MTTYVRFAIILGALSLCMLPRAAGAQPQMPNPYGAPITVEVARKLADVALAESKKNGWTVAAAIVDVGGNLVFFERTDNTQVGSIVVSQDKARTAVLFKRTTKVFEDAVAGGRHAVLSLPGVVPIEGGVPIVVDGKIIGAIGVSGGTSQQDGICAQAALDTLGKQIASPAPAPAPRPAAPAAAAPAVPAKK